MIDYLLGIIIRWSSGERFRKSTPTDWRRHSAFFVVLPIFLMAAGYFGHSFMEHANTTLIWLAFVLGMVVFGAVWLSWAKFVPSFVLLILGVFAWVGFALFSWHFM